MQPSQQTTVSGAALGAALGVIVVWLVEVLGRTDVPAAVEGALVVVVTALIALVYPPENRA